MIAETDVFLNTNDFAEEVTVTVKGSVTSSSVKIIFTEPGQAVGVGESQFITTAPVAEGKTSQLSTLVQGSTLVRGGVTYYINQNLPQGDGFTRLVLSKDQP